MELKIKRLNAGARLPSYQTQGSAGLDLHACLSEPLVIPRGGRALVPTGLAMEIAQGFEGQVRPRSGLAAKHGVTVLNAPGTIDSDYRGELKALLVNLGEEPFQIGDGDRIAQLIIAPVSRAHPIEVNELQSSSRGEGGFGSTGR